MNSSQIIGIEQKSEAIKSPIEIASLLYYSTRLEECISFVRDNKAAHASLPIQTRQELQMYEGLSLMASVQMDEGYECFQDLFQWVKAEKAGTSNSNNDNNDNDDNDEIKGSTETIDVIIECLYLWEIFQDEEVAVVHRLPHLKSICEAYKTTSESTPNAFNEGVYQFGMGLFSFFDEFDPFDDDSHLGIVLPNITAKLEIACENATERLLDITAILGWLAFRQKQFKKSLIYYQRVLDSNPSFPRINEHIAIAHLSVSNYDKAKLLYENALVLSPKNPLILCNITSMYLSIEVSDLDKAKIYLKQVLEDNNMSLIALWRKATLYLTLNKKKESEELCHIGLKINPIYSPLCKVLSQIYFESQTPEKSISLLQRELVGHPLIPYYKLEYALCMSHFDQLELAILSFRAFITQKLLKGRNSSNCYLVAVAVSELVKGLQANGRWIDCLETGIEFIEEVNGENPLINQVIRSIYQVLIKETAGVGIDEKLLCFENRNSNVVSKFKDFALIVRNIPSARKFFSEKLYEFELILAIIAYERECAIHLNFKNKIQLWDLYFD